MEIDRIVIAAGGTGGHLYPAQAFAKQWLDRKKSAGILFVASGLKENRCFHPEDFDYREIASSSLLSRNLFKAMKGILHVCKGFRQSVQILKEYKPQVVIGFGSYFTVPVILAARWLNIPIVLHEANSVPGKANLWLSHLSSCVGVHFPDAGNHFKQKTVQVDMPLREGYNIDFVSKKDALAYYGLSEDHRTLLICGGSQGAQAINRLVQDCVSTVKQLSLQIIHITGEREEAQRLSSWYASHKIPAQVKAFEKNMQMAWRVADGFIGRAGASTIAEAVQFEVPGLLIPYPFANQHQEKNADYFEHTVLGGWKLLQSGLSSDQLSKKIEALFQPEHQASFRSALQAYKQRPHHMTLCDLILQMNIDGKR